MPGIKIASNPIVNGTSDDPSTAWKTPHGEWRLIGNAKAYGQNKSGVAPIYAATEFTGRWHLVGDTSFPSGECPSFFPLPALYPGTTATGTLPTHVHKVCMISAIILCSVLRSLKGDVGFAAWSRFSWLQRRLYDSWEVGRRHSW